MKMRGEIGGPGSDDPALGLVQILDENGIADPARVPSLSPGEWVALYRWMLMARIADERFLALQRQGRIGFYAENTGHEASIFGSAAPLRPTDWTMPALREGWVSVYRGLPLRTFLAQIYGNDNDLTLGHQLPCHPGSRAIRHIVMSSCVGSQLPHATGIAHGIKIARKDEVVIGYLGDGATSEADWHVAANFAGVYGLPVVFVCQNNQWAISTPSDKQTAAPTFAIKALAYGFPGVRVDGNDIFAVYDTVSRAIERARMGGGPTLVECLGYRVSAHTSSDDPSRYRDERVTEEWRKKDPIKRFRAWLMAQGYLDEAIEERFRQEIEKEVREAVAAEEVVGPPPLRTLVEQVFEEVPRHLAEQLHEIEVLPRAKLGGVHQ